MEILGYIISLISCAGIIFSFQMKKNRSLFLIQTIAAFGFAISYLLGNDIGGFLINIVSFTNTLILYNKKMRKQPIKWFICAAYVVLPIITAFFVDTWNAKVIIENALAIFIGCMQVPYTLATWKDDGKIIRKVRLIALTPAWLSYNIFVFNPGGIICEVFNVVSIIVSFIRHRKDGFAK